MPTKIETQVIDSIVELLEMEDSSTITLETKIEGDLGIDSGLLLELFMMLEENVTDLEIDPAELRPEEFETVGSFAKMIATCVKDTVAA
ncbi:MAG: phosphopantetheine-binding protein [Pseudoruegeria sp.]